MCRKRGQKYTGANDLSSDLPCLNYICVAFNIDPKKPSLMQRMERTASSVGKVVSGTWDSAGDRSVAFPLVPTSQSV